MARQRERDSVHKSDRSMEFMIGGEHVMDRLEAGIGRMVHYVRCIVSGGRYC